MVQWPVPPPAYAPLSTMCRPQPVLPVWQCMLIGLCGCVKRHGALIAWRYISTCAGVLFFITIFGAMSALFGSITAFQIERGVVNRQAVHSLWIPVVLRSQPAAAWHAMHALANACRAAHVRVSSISIYMNPNASWLPWLCRERAGKAYHVLPYYLARSICDLPMRVGQGLLFGGCSCCSGLRPPACPCCPAVLAVHGAGACLLHV